ncbi:carboxymuconolactone decarboxylase family protein [Sphingobium sp.]|uniref:carboxymuconolactone decarboxylase family protein n=1 Tax=Sphingobium sp. TaxID=1912891 RepID=UPI0028BDBDD4|nr:carboxymuconolactone decarboxylase family protein [Sphingobium sp.]
MTGIFPPLDIPAGPDRLPRQNPADYDAGQREAAAALIASPRGEVRGPFVPMMRSPQLMDRAQKLGEFLRYQCSIPERLREWAIIVTARFWQQAYEWHVHAPLAARAGVAIPAIAALAEGRMPDSAAADERIVHDFCLALHRDHFVGDALYAEALSLLGEKGVVELSGICGYYALLAMMLNMARTPAPGEAFAIPF